MRLLIISSAYPPMPSGESTNAYYLSRHLSDRDVEVHVLTCRGNGAADVPRVMVHPIMENWSWPELPRLAGFLKRCNPDAILLMYLGWIYRYHPMITFAPTISKRISPRIPFVTRFENVQGFDPEQTSLGTRALRRCMARWAGRERVDYAFGTLLRDSDRIIVLTDYHRHLLSRSLPSVTDKSVLIPPPPNMKMVPGDDGEARRNGRSSLGVGEHEFLVVYMGYIYPGKGIETLLEAFRLVCSGNRRIRLVMVGGSIAGDANGKSGSSYPSRMQELAKALRIDDRLIWTGEYRWDSGDASTYLHAADLCVLPFDHGVYLNNSSFASAASHGVPIVSTAPRDLDKAFVHGQNVFLCPPGSPDGLAAAIQAVMDDGVMRKRLSAGSLSLAEEWFTWDNAVNRTIAALRNGFG